MEPMGGRAQGSWQQEGGAEQRRPFGSQRCCIGRLGRQRWECLRLLQGWANKTLLLLSSAFLPDLTLKNRLGYVPVPKVIL